MVCLNMSRMHAKCFQPRQACLCASHSNLCTLNPVGAHQVPKKKRDRRDEIRRTVDRRRIACLWLDADLESELRHVLRCQLMSCCCLVRSVRSCCHPEANKLRPLNVAHRQTPLSLKCNPATGAKAPCQALVLTSLDGTSRDGFNITLNYVVLLSCARSSTLLAAQPPSIDMSRQEPCYVRNVGDLLTMIHRKRRSSVAAVMQVQRLFAAAALLLLQGSLGGAHPHHRRLADDKAASGECTRAD